MITNVSLVTVYCLDQDKARDFYVDVLGFTPRTDITLGEGFRWVTVGHPSQPELDLTLMTPGPPLDDEAAAFVRRQLEKGQMGGVGLTVDDCRKTFEELSAKGVDSCRSRRTGPTASRPSCATSPATGWCSWSRGSSRPPTSRELTYPRPGCDGALSATTAPRRPSGCSGPTVESRRVWRSASALIVAPAITRNTVIHNQNMLIATPASEP